MVPLQGLTLVGHCPLDGHMTAPHGVYPNNGEYTPNGKPHHATQCLSATQQVETLQCSLAVELCCFFFY